MDCTNKEQDTCRVEKMGCIGCAYNTESFGEPDALKEIAYIEKRLTNLSKMFEFRYVITNHLTGLRGETDYEDVSIKVYKELN